MAKKLQERSRGVVTKTVPRKAGPKKKTQKDVDAEIARYMKELGLD